MKASERMTREQTLEDRIAELNRENKELRDKVGHFESHYEAAMANWREVLDQRDRLQSTVAALEKEVGWWNCQCHGKTEFECKCGSATAFVTYRHQVAALERERDEALKDKASYAREASHCKALEQEAQTDLKLAKKEIESMRQFLAPIPFFIGPCSAHRIPDQSCVTCNPTLSLARQVETLKEALEAIEENLRFWVETMNHREDVLKRALATTRTALAALAEPKETK